MARPPNVSSHSGGYSSLERRYTNIIQQTVNLIVRRVSDLELFIWREKLDTNPNLSPTDKLVLAKLRNELNRLYHRREADGFTPIWLGSLQQKGAIGYATVKRCILRMVLSGIVTRKTVRDEEMKLHIFLALSQQALERPETLTLKDMRNHGGLRCKHCGGELVVTELTCKECGQVYRKRGKK